MKNDYLLAALLLLTTFLAVPPALADNNTRREDKFLKEWYIEDEQVETATRSPKPMAQVAENVTIVTAEEIEAMHAHTLQRFSAGSQECLSIFLARISLEIQ